MPLKNSYNEDLELASLLVHLDVVRGRVSELMLLMNCVSGHSRLDLGFLKSFIFVLPSMGTMLFEAKGFCCCSTSSVHWG